MIKTYSDEYDLYSDYFLRFYSPIPSSQTFNFEHWQEGKMIEILSIEASTCQEGVSLLSDRCKKGVFRLCQTASLVE